MGLNSYYHDLMGKAAKDYGNHFTTGPNSHCLRPRCLLTSAPDTNKTFKLATLLRRLPNDTDANLASKPISQIPGEAQVLLLQLVIPNCRQPPPLETQSCSSYSEVSHQIQHYLVPSACEGFKKKFKKLRSAWGLTTCWEQKTTK